MVSCGLGSVMETLSFMHHLSGMWADGLWEGLALFLSLLPLHAPGTRSLIAPEPKDSRTLAC